MPDIGNLLKKLSEEKFGGKEPVWKKARWGDADVLCVGDSDFWYYQRDNVIYIQSKKDDLTPHCYDCKSELEFKEQSNSVWFEEWSGPVGGGEVITKNIPYCPKCEEEPKGSGILIE